MKWVNHKIIFWVAVLVQTCAFAAATSVLPPNRILQFDDYAVAATWTHDGPAPTGGGAYNALRAGTNHFHSTGWRLLSCRTGTARGRGREVAPDSTTNFAANLQNTLSAQIESPVFQEGIGTIYFEAINNVETTEILVEWSTSMVDPADPYNVFPLDTPSTNGLEYVWTTITNLTLDVATAATGSGPHDFKRFAKTLNYRQPAKLRICRTGDAYPLTLDDALTVIDNIRVSFPPSDLIVYKKECPFDPGYPSVNTNITIRCLVDNLDLNVPNDASSRTNRVVYRWRYLDQVVGPWKTNQMERVVGSADGNGNGEIFQSVLPPQTQVGDLEYYFTCDFDGPRYQSPDYTLLNYAYGSERIPAFTLRGGVAETGEREFYTRIRPFISKYGAMQIVSDQVPQPIEMALVGDDEWRGMVPVRSVSMTNVSWYFKGMNAYEPGADAYSTNVLCWTEQAQVGVGRVPYGGRCVQTNEDTRIRVTGVTGGYLQAVFNTRTLEYMTCRAEYQSFNAWPAPEFKFSDSGGQDPRQQTLKTFEDWPVNQDQTFKEFFQDRVNSTNVFSRDSFETNQRWLSGSSAYAVDRIEADYANKPSGYVGFRNQSLRLKGGDGALGLGYVYNTVASRPDGLKQFSFKCRLSQSSSNDMKVVYNMNEFTKTNYLVRATVLASSMSPEQPSLSLIAYYRDPENFYEYRITQIPDPQNASSSRDKRVNHQLFKWVNGVPSLKVENKRDADALLTSSTVIEMRLFNTSGTATRIRCKFGTVEDVLTFTDSSSPIQFGTYGFFSADCTSFFSTVITAPTITDAVGSTPEVSVLAASVGGGFNTQKLNWFVPAGRFVASDTITPCSIYSVTPAQKIGVYLQESDYSVTNEPASPGSAAWKKVQEYTVPGFGFTGVTMPLNSWKSQFVMLQVMGGATDVAVDELEVSSWHGKLTSDSGDDNKAADWKATEAWVVSNSVPQLNVVQLDHTRADPSFSQNSEKAQAIRSPRLNKGMGLMEFDYRVVRGPAKLTVQSLLTSGSSSTDWTSLQSFATNTATGWLHASAYVGNTNSGFLRVLNERGGVYTNALVEINNVIVWDEPQMDATSWRVYNAKVTASDAMRVALDESKACFLNNSRTADAEPIQDQSEPFLQTPALPSGLGELTFQARAYSNAQPATLSIYASTNGWGAASNLWFEIGKVQNITNMLYQTYSFKTLDGKKYDALRLQTATTNGARRVCVEEVAASEPVFPGFDIVNVKTLNKTREGAGGYIDSAVTSQPLISDDVGVEAQISNIQLSPSNIQMFVTYYVGTNVWGADNWPAGQTVTKPMFPTYPNSVIYRTAPSNDIPVQEQNQIVQYHVWASYLGGIPLVEEQESFENPPWYYPVDLNQTFAAQGWSPYYIVYGLPLGAVWINEINATDYVIGSNGVQQISVGDNPYIEIAVPAGVDLAGWKVELVTGENYAQQTIQLPAGLPEQADQTNGYAFFVIGEHPALRSSSVPALPKLDYAFPYLTDLIPRTMPGGLRLRRPMGMYEQVIAYEWNAAYGDSFSGANWAARDPQHRFVFVGREHNGGSLNVTNGVGENAENWTFPLTWTPGELNAGQVIQSAKAILPGVSNVLVTSVMNSDKAMQNGRRTTPYTLKLLRGASTNIVFKADSWYRIFSVKMNESEQLPPDSALSDYTLDLPSIQSNINVSAMIGLRTDVADLTQNPTLLSWILSFGDADLVTSHYNGRPLSLTELYWLNANPTATNRLEFMVTKFNVETNNDVRATVKLALNGQNVTNLQGSSVMKLQVKSALAEANWSFLAQYALGRDSFDTNQTSRITIRDPFSILLPGWDPLKIFCRGQIEMEDPRLSVGLLITE
jgi:hypothetical protein